MNDFDDRLSSVLGDDGIDRDAPAPALANSVDAWKRRRTLKFSALGTVAAAMIGVAGFSAAALIDRDAGPSLVVTDSTPSRPSTVDTVATTQDSTPATSVSDEAADTTLEPATTPPTTAAPTSVAPTSAAPTTAAEPAGAGRVNEALVRSTVTVDVDNRLEIRDAVGNVLWAHEYCDATIPCSASLQTVTTEDAWLIVDEGDGSAGPPTSSILRRVSLADGAAVDEATAGPGAFLTAGQPTEVGLVLATSTDTDQGFRVDVVAIDGGVEVALVDDVDAVEISADGRYLATTASNPSEGYGETTLRVRDIATGRSAESVLPLISAAPGEWSPDGTHLVVDNRWETTNAYLVDPWTSADTAPDSPLQRSDEAHWEHACFVDDSTIAVATWDSPYAEESAVPGSILLIDVDTLSTVGDLKVDAYGRGLVCHDDGTATFVSVPLITETFGAQGPNPFEIVQPDRDARTEIVHATGDGELVVTGGDADGVDAVR